MKEDYKKYGQTNYYWILEFLDNDYERSSYKTNGADLVLKMNDAKDIKELLKIRMEIHQFIEHNKIGRNFVNEDVLSPLAINRMDKFVNRCFNGNIVRLIEELPSDEESIGKALELYVNSYYIDSATDERITSVLRKKFGNSISGKLANLEGVKMKYWDCLDKRKSYPEGSNGRKKLLEQSNKLQKELKRCGYVLHIYDGAKSKIVKIVMLDVVLVIVIILFLILLGFIIYMSELIGIFLVIIGIYWVLSRILTWFLPE